MTRSASPVRGSLTVAATEDLIATVDDLLLLAEVVEAGGFGAASERSGIPKSRLSRRVAALEERLGVCLLVRDSRRFKVTEMGQRLYEQGLQIRAATQSAVTMALDSTAEAGGVLRVACPIALSTAVVSQMAVAFASAHPRVRLCLTTTKGLPESPGEHFDVVIRPSIDSLPDSDTIARRLASVPYALVAAPGIVAGRALEGLAALEGLPAIGWNSSEADTVWHLLGPAGAQASVPLAVRFAGDNLLIIREAALAGLGVARLPVALFHQDIDAGRLCVVAPGWAPAPMTIYALYPSRRHLSLAGQSFIAMLKDTVNAFASLAPQEH